MTATKDNTRTDPKPRLKPAKQWSRETGIPYGSLRDAHFRGELAIIRIGKSDRHAAWYIEEREGERWIQSRKDAGGR